MTDEPTPLDTIVTDNVALDPRKVLDEAMKSDDLEATVVITRHTDGAVYIASSHGIAEAVFLIEQAKWNMMQDSME